ncbi:MAG: type II toxin-antitoxin system VapC family toxin [Nitrospinae bacterium]|nr:type II toxin-antitoxin system VapC family toxin [Nitrospinota bacterium]
MKLPHGLRWIYIDTSTYLKLFLKEKGSDKARKLAKENSLLSSAILASECFSALSRRKHSREIDDKTFDRLVTRIKKNLPYIEIVKLSDDVSKKTEEVVLHSTARTLDAVHIASALLFHDLTGISLTFVTSDKRQEESAKNEGLKTIFIG